MKEQTKWKILAAVILTLLGLISCGNGIMVGCRQMPGQPAFGILCGVQALAGLAALWVAYMLPEEEGKERSKTRKMILTGIMVLAAAATIAIFILQMMTGKYDPFSIA